MADYLETDDTGYGTTSFTPTIDVNSTVFGTLETTGPDLANSDAYSVDLVAGTTYFIRLATGTSDNFVLNGGYLSIFTPTYTGFGLFTGSSGSDLEYGNGLTMEVKSDASGDYIEFTVPTDGAYGLTFRHRYSESLEASYAFTISDTAVPPVPSLTPTTVVTGPTPGDDVLMGTDDADTIDLLAGNDTYDGGKGADIIDGGDGIDTIEGGNGSDLINGGDGDDDLSGGNDADLMNGGEGNDKMRGGVGNDTINGDDGDDDINGGKGADLINGGDGDDYLRGDRQNDVLNGGEGNDTLQGDIGNDTLNGDNGDDDLDGGIGNDILNGGAGNDTIEGGDGADIISGGSDDDFIFGGGGQDNIDGGSGNDTIEGGTGADVIRGKRGDDVIDGGDQGDNISGGTGNDTIIGGKGNDTLYGNNGNDVFVFTQGGNVDTIKDFELGVDKLDVTDFGTISISDALAALELAGSDTIINFGNGDKVILENVSVFDLGLDDFIFEELIDDIIVPEEPEVFTVTAYSYY